MNFSWVYVQYVIKTALKATINWMHHSNLNLILNCLILEHLYREFALRKIFVVTYIYSSNFLVKLSDKESLKLILTPENTIRWYEQGAKDTWTSKIADKLVQAVKEKNTFKEPEANFKVKFFWHNLGQWNSGLKNTDQFLNLLENVEQIMKQKKEDMYNHFCDNIQVDLPPNHPLKSWHAIKYLIPLHTYLVDNIWDNEIEEITRPDLKGVDERFFKNSAEELFKLIDKCQKQNLKEINEATWLQMLYPQIDATVADFAQLISQNTSNSLSQLIGSDESRKPDYTVFCITKDNPSLEFAALFLEGAKPVKKNELGDRKYQLDKERLQSIIKLYFDYILDLTHFHLTLITICS
ncbi:hypothetical protein C2G38_2218362 [Gigaspora rosea]|uniref:Uncharacterized protein n=1 Tax=Gigaspora rosea TaxID=44941 RepID=A0A397U6S1_9GLOM|nr:hypothetical protein C2G38_2218362 [Gigaspora rosea]